MSRPTSLRARDAGFGDTLTPPKTDSKATAPKLGAREDAGTGVRRLGIIGGLGPVATAALYLDVCRLVHARESVTPAILVDSVRMPRTLEESFVASIPELENERELRDIVRDAIARLAAGGAGAICAACNTVQPLLASEAARVGVATIDMVDATIATAQQRGYGSALVLGSASACRLDVYGEAARHAGITLTYPDKDEQRAISHVILELTHRSATEMVVGAIAAICHRYEQRIDCILLACTDLSQLRAAPLGTCPIIDSLAELGAAAATFLWSNP